MKVAAEVGSTANQYRILAKLAVGGMAEIYLARGASVAGVARYCVLKRILRDRAHDAQLAQMFLDEARLAAQLQHPNIASVYDIGMLGESYFFTMEYVHGETVRALLARGHAIGRALPLACVMTVIAGAAAGLHHAHERNGPDGRPLGIVHRDVSPSNLMISFEGNTKLVDFGVAKADDRAVETRSGTVKGKISYLSPEQCRGVRVDRRSDVFSLGIVTWEMLTGHRLFSRSSDFENMTAIVHDAVPLPSSQRPDIPRPIDDIVMKMLAKDVAQRYQSADEVVEAIENASMRAGTILSTSAVARLLRDLFGTRAEPWLALPDDERGAATLVSRPVPGSLPGAPSDPFEAELLEVPDLSPSQVLETEDLPHAKLAVMLPPALPGLPPPIAALPGLPRLPPMSGEPQPASASSMEPPCHSSQPDSRPGLQTIIAAALPLGPFGMLRPRPPSHGQPSHLQPSPAHGHATLLGVEAPMTTSPSGPMAIHLAALPHLASQPMPPAHELATSSDMIALQGMQQIPWRPIAARRRSLAPLIAVVSLAAIAGIATVWLLMRRARPSADHVAVPATLPLDAAVEPVVPDAQLVVIVPDASPVAAVPDAPPEAPPPDDAAVPPDALSATVAPHVTPPPAPPLPVGPQPTFDMLMNLFNSNQFSAMVAVCRRAQLATAIARACLLAACIEHDTPQAQRWLPLASSRPQLAAYCASKGTTLR